MYFKSINSIAFCVIVAITAAAQVPTKISNNLLNLDKNGCMVQGFDCVAMMTMPDSTIKGNSNFESTYQGGKYWFVSAENKALFDKNPKKYAPLYGGFCGIAVTEGNLRPVQIWTHTITEGHLVLNHNAKARKLWLNKPRKNFGVAEKKWPIVSQKDAKYDIIHSNETQESLSNTSYETQH
jgi:YHS domain-containing protein